MKVVKTVLSLMTIVGLLFLFGCGSEIDSFLDDLESNVETTEAMAASGQKATKEDMEKLKKMDEEFGAKYKDMKKGEFTDSQKKRIEDLMGRLLKARMQVMANQ